MVGDQLSRDAAFSLLSNRRRRQLLCLLVRSGETQSLRVSARDIVGRLEGIDSAEITDEAYRSVYVSLYQSHAPQLAAAGIVDYDETERTVRILNNRRTETLLRIVGIDPNGSQRGDRWTARVLTAIVLGTVLCGLLSAVDRIWLVPWAVSVGGFLAFQLRQYDGTVRLVPVRDCGTLATIDDSPADVVDDGTHSDH